MHWYTILEAGSISPEGMDDIETENRILPDPRNGSNTLITRLSKKNVIIQTITSMRLNIRADMLG